MKEKEDVEPQRLEEKKAEVQTKILAFKDLWEQIGKLGEGTIKQDIGESGFDAALNFMIRMTDNTLPFVNRFSDAWPTYSLGGVWLDLDVRRITLRPGETKSTDEGEISQMELTHQGRDNYFSFFVRQPEDYYTVGVTVREDICGRIEKVLYHSKRKIDVLVPGGRNSKWVVIEKGKFDVL